ncbi:hypothetical protein [Veronia pacifica]|uniref:Bacterial virulence factor lipase N-terminal domain-containing protein n=1 Tax=Veronia pacifica TaxID=1080227 RepID=A0A1C3ERJ9_9GAMM|nr:hypothetical protein [Veronia pacifica]ODA35844.1 hypothetical protein A8L45_02065 [Veronia pacifica]
MKTLSVSYYFQILFVFCFVVLTGCDAKPKNEGAETETLFLPQFDGSLNAQTKVTFILGGPGEDLPRPYFIIQDSLDGTVNLPADYGTDSSLENPFHSLSTLDGWSVSKFIQVGFSGKGFPEEQQTITEGVHLFRINQSFDKGTPEITAEIPVSAYTRGKNLFIQPLELLDAKSEYIYVVTDAVRDRDGVPVGTSRAYATLATGTTPALGDRLNRASRITVSLNEILDDHSTESFDIESEDIIFSGWFTTQSIGDDLKSTKYAMLKSVEQGGLETLWKGSKANPNNVDLSRAYQMSFDNTQDFGSFLSADQNFDKYVVSQAGGDAPQPGSGPSPLKQLLLDLNGGLALLDPLLGGVKMQVTTGKVSLPYFLYSDDNWRSLRARPASPNIYTLSHLLNKGEPEDRAAITRQLNTLSVEPELIASMDILHKQDEMIKLLGADIRLADGSHPDTVVIDGGSVPSTVGNITRYSPYPAVQRLEDVPFLLITPQTLAPDKPLNLVIYKHAVIASKETVLAMAPRMIALNRLSSFWTGLVGSFQPFINIFGDILTLFGIDPDFSWIRGDSANLAILVIDLPLHGERSLDEERSANVDPTAYIALQNMAVGKSVFYQTVYDLLGLRLAVDIAQDTGALVGTPLEAMNTEPPSFMAHSLGGVAGLTAVAIAQNDDGSDVDHASLNFSSIAMATVSAGISDTLLNSSEFELTVKHFISEAQSKGYRNYMESAGEVCDSQLSDDLGQCYAEFVVAAQNSAELSDVQVFLEEQFVLFSFAAQMMLDSVDPHNYAKLKNQDGSYSLGEIPILAFQVEDDLFLSNSIDNSPFSGSEPLAKLLGLPSIDQASNQAKGDRNIVKFNSDAVHTSVIGPTNPDPDTGQSLDFRHNSYMQILFAEFFDSQGQTFGDIPTELLAE